MVSRDTDGEGEYRFLTGNEIAALLTHFKLHQLSDRRAAAGVADRRHDRGDDRRMVTRIARHFNAQVVDDLLVGFKYIADVLWQLERRAATRT